MPDAADMAAELTDAATRRSIAASRALVSRAEPVRGDCDECPDEDVWVLRVGGALRCTACRAKMERRA